MVLRVQVPGDRPVRADRLLADALPGFSRRRVQRLLDEGRIRVDGRRPSKGTWLPPGGEITIEVEDDPTLEPGNDLAIPVLFEDETILVLDKPAGRPAHALRPTDRGTIANFLAARYPESRNASRDPLEHGLAHRLDTDTSGVIVVARTREAWTALRARFEAREIAKGYVALVCGSLASPGEIVKPIEPDPRSRRRVRVLAPGEEASSSARPAVTRYRPRVRYASLTLLDVEMPTGVRHQIRAHLASIGHPVAGDVLYGAPADPRFPRHFLHAARIAFRHPATDRPLRFESPLPEDFGRILAALS